MAHREVRHQGVVERVVVGGVRDRELRRAEARAVVEQVEVRELEGSDEQEHEHTEG